VQKLIGKNFYGAGFIFTKEIAYLIIQEAGPMAVVPFDKEEILTGSLEYII
jgi:hypothetical protein